MKISLLHLPLDSPHSNFDKFLRCGIFQTTTKLARITWLYSRVIKGTLKSNENKMAGMSVNISLISYPR